MDIAKWAVIAGIADRHLSDITKKRLAQSIDDGTGAGSLRLFRLISYYASCHQKDKLKADFGLTIMGLSFKLTSGRISIPH